MTVDYVDPNGDVQKEWNSACPNHYECIDGGVRQPAAPTSDNINAVDGDENDIDRFYLTSLPDVQEVTSVKIWIYGNNTTGEHCLVDLQMGSLEPWEGYQTVNMDSGYAWFSKTFNGSWTQTNLDQCQVRFKADSAYGKFDTTWIRAFYCEVTYSEVPTGYSHKVNGVLPAHIGKINGVPTAHIAKVNGV